MQTDEVQIDVDSRGRLTLGRLAGGHRHFLASAIDDGSIVLRPAVVRSVLEDRLLRDATIPATVAHGLASPKRIRNRPRSKRV